MTHSDPPFATLFGFPFGTQSDLNQRVLVAFGAPVQSAHPRRQGTGSGPSVIRQASCDVVQTYLSSPSRAAVDLSTGTTRRLRDLGTSLDIGDLACGGPVSTASIASVAQATAAIIVANSCPILLGGDHRVFEGLVRGVQDSSKTPDNLPGIISFSDKITLPAAIDDEALPLAALATACDADCPLLCVGVNGLQSGQAWEMLNQVGGQIVSADELYEHHAQALATINDFLGKHQSLVCCIDLECIDSGHAAGTPSVNVGGLTPEQLIALVTQIDLAHALVALAVTNVAPELDARGLTELTAAEAMMAALDSRLFDKVEA
ncbi:MAG: arginase family enzyme [Gammaproteobacteria bacterium]|jgi:arginase family enzyme